MIKCGDKLEGKPQCILYSKDGSKVLGRFPYSKHGGQKGAKAAAHKREGQIQFFKQKHQGLLEAIDAFGAPAVLKYMLESDCEDCQQVVKTHVADWLEKARGEGQSKGGERQGDGGADQCICPKCGATAAHEKGTPCNEQKCPKCGATMAGQAAEKSESEIGEEVEKKKKLPYGGSFSRMWSEKFGGSVEKCIKMVGDKVSDPGAYCAKLKDRALKRTTWRGKGKHEKKSFEDTIEEALTLLQKDEDEEMELDDIDLSELEAWLEGKETANLSEQTGVEPEPTEAEPEPETDAEPEPAPKPEPEPVEEPELDFHTFLLREHAQRRADILAALGEEVIEDG